MSEVRLVAIDLDGTLLRSDRTISPRSRAAINAARAAGIDVVIATARSPRSTREIAAEAGVGGLAICANGAIVFDLDADRIVTHRPLAAATAHRLVIGLRDACPGVVFGWESELRFGSEPAYEAQRNVDWWPRPEDSFPACDPLEWAQPMTKLLARPAPEDLDHVHVIAKELAGIELLRCRSREQLRHRLRPLERVACGERVLRPRPPVRVPLCLVGRLASEPKLVLPAEDHARARFS